MKRTLAVLAFAGLLLAAVIPSAYPHDERESFFPSGDGHVPKYRTKGAYLVVCKADSMERSAGFSDDVKERNRKLFKECKSDGFKHIQAAVDAVTQPKTRILVMPGVYLEQPSMKPPTGKCAAIAEDVEAEGGNMTYGQHLKCPHNQNMIAVLGDGTDKDRACDNQLCSLQIEGTGEFAEDVVVDGQFSTLNVIRADRADGIYIRNLTVQHSLFNGIYVIETDGYTLDRVVGRWGDEYGFLTFTSDHGLMKNCEAYGNGDAGVYPGSAAPLFGERYSMEIRNCDSHHNLLGFSGTAGNSVYVHDSKFHHNSAGISMDSLFPSHPGLPQNHGTFESNQIYSNNEDYYAYYRDGTCDLPHEERGYDEGVVCPTTGVPVGTGIITAGGNDNLFVDNEIYDNWRYGAMLFWIPAYLRGETNPDLFYDTSHRNAYLDNRMGFGPEGSYLPNGVDFWWDEEGEGNCWQGNTEGMAQLLTDPVELPDCDPPPPFTDVNSAKQQQLVACSTWSKQDYDPEGCDWFHQPPPPSRATGP